MNRFFAHRRATAAAVAFASTLLLLTGGSVARSAPPVGPTRAGIAYDPSAPLDAVVTPKWNPEQPPEVLTYAVKFRGAEDQTVPALFVTPSAKLAPEGPKPTVILMHGLGGSKEQVYLGAVPLAKQGFSVLMIDAAGHGERPKIDGKAVSQLNLSEMHHLCGETIIDLRRAVDFLATRPEVDKNRIGYLGISLGGILGGVFIADDPRIKDAVLWAAGGDWGKLIATTTHQDVASYRSSPDFDPAKIESVMRDVDPLYTIADFAPRPLLFLNGDKDTIVPVPCANALYDAAKMPKERVVLPGGHIPDLATMLDKSFKWLTAKLGPTTVTTTSAANSAAAAHP